MAPRTPFLIVTGQHIGLASLRKDLLPLYHRWYNDLTLQRTTRHPRVISIEEVTSEFDGYVSSTENAAFTIYELTESGEAGRPVGNAALTGIDYRNRTADYEIIIGEPDARGRGYGTEATRLVLDYAFTVLGLRNVMLTVYANNPAGIRAYEKAGFRQFGRRTAAVEVAGQAFDVIYMECLASEFKSPLLGQVFHPQKP